MQRLKQPKAGGATPWLSRFRQAPAKWHLPGGLSAPSGGSRFIAPATLEGSPRSHPVPRGGSIGRAHSNGPCRGTLRPALNGEVSARKGS